MLLIALLLVMLSLGVTSLPTTGAGMSLMNATNILDEWNANPLCDWAGAPPDLYHLPGDCRCWAGYSHTNAGADRAWMLDAISEACGRFTGGIGEPMAMYGLGYGLSQGRTAFHYVDDYKIAVTLHVQNYQNCVGPLPVSERYCWRSLKSVLDACNTGGENDKYGGYQKWDCVTWILDASPDDHWPYPASVLN